MEPSVPTKVAWKLARVAVLRCNLSAYIHEAHKNNRKHCTFVVTRVKDGIRALGRKRRFKNISQSPRQLCNCRSSILPTRNEFGEVGGNSAERRSSVAASATSRAFQNLSPIETAFSRNQELLARLTNRWTIVCTAAAATTVEVRFIVANNRLQLLRFYTRVIRTTLNSNFYCLKAFFIIQQHKRQIALFLLGRHAWCFTVWATRTRRNPYVSEQNFISAGTSVKLSCRMRHAVSTSTAGKQLTEKNKN